MKKLIALSALCFCAHSLLGQNLESTTNASSQEAAKKTAVFKYAEQMPEYRGGEQALYQYLSQNISYPDSARQNKIEGLVRVKFVVNEQGYVVHAECTSPKLGYGLEEEALRVVKKMPQWKPAYSNGKPVSVYYQIPIRFTLPKNDATSDSTSKG